MFHKLDPARPCLLTTLYLGFNHCQSTAVQDHLHLSTWDCQIKYCNCFQLQQELWLTFSSTFQVESFRTACWIRFATMGELLLQFNWTTNLRLLSNCVWLIGSCCNLQRTDVSPNRFRLLPLIGELLNGGAVHLPPGQLWLMKRWRSFPHFFKWRSSQLWLVVRWRSFPLFFKWRSSQQALVDN